MELCTKCPTGDRLRCSAHPEPVLGFQKELCEMLEAPSYDPDWGFREDEGEDHEHFLGMVEDLLKVLRKEGEK